MGSSPRGHPAPDHRPGERRQREGSQQGRDALLEYQGTQVPPRYFFYYPLLVPILK